MKQLDVAVIGGGFAGLSAAYEIQKKGYSVAVFERNGYLAEKTQTDFAGEHPVEMGTCYIARDYDAVMELGAELGVSWKRHDSSSEFAKGSLAPGSTNRLTGNVGYFIANAPSFYKYMELWPAMTERFMAGDQETVDQLSRPIPQWLESVGLSKLLPVFSIIGDCFGYGPTNAVPAFYLTRFVTPEMIKTFVLRQLKTFITWNDVIEGLGKRLDVTLNAGLSAGTYDETQCIWTLTCGEETVEAKRLIIACPPNLPQLQVLFDDERSTFIRTGMKHSVFMTAHIECTSWFRSHRRTLLQEIGGVDAVSVARRETPVKQGKAHYLVCFPLSKANLPDKEAKIAQDIERDGGRLDRIHRINIYQNYNTHFCQNALKAGAYHRFKALQGEKSLWLVNSAIAHENWRDLYALAKTTATEVTYSLLQEGSYPKKARIAATA